jgi:hypothetical protein
MEWEGRGCCPRLVVHFSCRCVHHLATQTVSFVVLGASISAIHCWRRAGASIGCLRQRQLLELALVFDRRGWLHLHLSDCAAKNAGGGTALT